MPDPAAVERGLGEPREARREHPHLRRVAGRRAQPLRRRHGGGDRGRPAARASAWSVPFAVSDVFAKGGDGGIELAEAVDRRTPSARSQAASARSTNWSEPVKVKMPKIAHAMYGAQRRDVDARRRERDLARSAKLGYERSAALRRQDAEVALRRPAGRSAGPEDFEITVRDVLLAAGAGYLVPLLGDIIRMPGLPASPQAERMDLVDGRSWGSHPSFPRSPSTVRGPLRTRASCPSPINFAHPSGMRGSENHLQSQKPYELLDADTCHPENAPESAAVEEPVGWDRNRGAARTLKPSVRSFLPDDPIADPFKRPDAFGS